MTAAVETAKPPEATDAQAASMLPEPAGYRLLIALPEIEQKTDGGIIRPDAVIDRERVSAVVGYVLKAGPEAYADEKKFPEGPWCQEGDFVLMQAYTGVRLRVKGKEFRVINDDQVVAVVDDPRGIERA